MTELSCFRTSHADSALRSTSTSCVQAASLMAAIACEACECARSLQPILADCNKELLRCARAFDLVKFSSAVDTLQLAAAALRRCSSANDPGASASDPDASTFFQQQAIACALAGRTGVLHTLLAVTACAGACTESTAVHTCCILTIARKHAQLHEDPQLQQLFTARFVQACSADKQCHCQKRVLTSLLDLSPPATECRGAEIVKLVEDKLGDRSCAYTISLSRWPWDSPSYDEGEPAPNAMRLLVPCALQLCGELNQEIMVSAEVPQGAQLCMCCLQKKRTRESRTQKGRGDAHEEVFDALVGKPYSEWSTAAWPLGGACTCVAHGGHCGTLAMTGLDGRCDGRDLVLLAALRPAPECA
jgi:hypothetical protein